MPQCKHTKNTCPDHYSLLSCWICIIFHTIVVHEPSVCHDLDTRSYLQGQGHNARIPKNFIRAVNVYCHVGFGYFMQLLSIIQKCVMTLTQGHISKAKVTVHIYRKSVSGHNSLLSCWIWIFFY